MAKEDISTSVDQETQGLVRGGYSPPPPKPASGEKLVKQIDRFAAASRNGKGN